MSLELVPGHNTNFFYRWRGDEAIGSTAGL
jgi:hypothetical protein